VPALDPASLPRHRGASLRAALCDGEDYELLLALDGKADRPAFARAWHRAFPGLPLTGIGRFVRPRDLSPGALRLADYRGYAHLG
jgi:thiamine-monophosphate kinase